MLKVREGKKKAEKEVVESNMRTARKCIDVVGQCQIEI